MQSTIHFRCPHCAARIKAPAKRPAKPSERRAASSRKLSQPAPHHWRSANNARFSSDLSGQLTGGFTSGPSAAPGA